MGRKNSIPDFLPLSEFSMTHMSDTCESWNMNVYKCKDYHGITCFVSKYSHSSEGTSEENCVEDEFRRTVEVAQSIKLFTMPSHHDISHMKNLGRAAKGISGIQSTQHRGGVRQQILRSYSCYPSKTKRSGAFFTTQLPPSKRRLALAPLPRRRSSSSTFARAKAVLPNVRKRMLFGEKYPKRFSHSVARRDRVELIAGRGLPLETSEGGNLETKSPRRQCLGVYNVRDSTGATCSNPLEREPTTCVSPIEDIDSVTIFRHLNVLKRGGYWKHLPRDDPPREGRANFPRESQYTIRKEENKENSPSANHPNARVPSALPTEWDVEEDDDDEYLGVEADGHGTIVENPFEGSALATGGHRSDTLGEFAGFRVHAITDDGWLCGSEPYRESSAHDQQHQLQQPLLLLHLPRKVAALARSGMFVRGVDLMKRRDNGALEPHSHQDGNDSQGNRDRSLGDSLFGRILL
mmetsp:Transcript_26914/g.63211  ORF Transcript_26914/g.63211 Transcript_26914/m.63211 type:complete len:464 (+) Transcript_26914:166-1557(+)